MNRSLSQKKIEEIKRELQGGATHAEAAKRTHVSMGSVSNVRRMMNEDELQVKRLTRSKTQMEQAYKESMKEVERLQSELSAFTEVQKYVRAFEPIKLHTRQARKGEAVAVCCWNDWHLEEVVNRAAVNGVNEYNPAIAKQRFHRLLPATASIIEMCRSKSKIDTLIVCILGDLITGYIHDELIATNAMTPPEAVLEAFDMVTSGIDFLLKETGVKEIIVPCHVGNHGRWTKKRWAKKSPGMSFEWLVYSFLAKWFIAKRSKRVRVLLPQGSLTYLDVYDRRVRLLHGDDIRYAGGIGGVHIPLRKALDGWNTQRRAGINYLGHWHNDITGEDYRVSGSLIGYNEFSIRIKARYQDPSQAFELIHPKYGSTARFPIVVDTKPKM
jgi:hypothetical protein